MVRCTKHAGLVPTTWSMGLTASNLSILDASESFSTSWSESGRVILACASVHE
jgi:hypothetical protein